MERLPPASAGANLPVSAGNSHNGTAPYAGGGYNDEAGEGLQLHEAWLIIVRSRWLILGVAAVVLGITALFTWLQEPVYRSAATLRIDDTGTNPSPLSEIGALSGAGTGVIETEMVVLESRQIAEAVVDSLHLQVELLEPDVARSEVLRVLDVSRIAAPAVYELTREDDGSYRVRADGRRAGAVRGSPSRVEIGQPVEIGAATIALSPSLRADPPALIRFAVRPFGEAVRAVQRDLGVSRPKPAAQIVAVHYQSTDPDLAAAVPNATVESFIEYKGRTSRTESTSTVEFLREQVEAYERQLRGAESNLQAYREQAQIVNPEAAATQQVQQLAQLQAERDALRTEQSALAELLAQVRTRSAQTEGGPSPYRQLASFPVFLSNRAVQDILQSITQLENRRAELMVLRTSESPDVRGIDQRIEELELQLYRTATNYLASLESQLASVDANLARFGDRLEQIPAREVQFARLSREAHLLENLYTLLQTRLKEAEIRNAVEPGNVRPIDPALVPDSPISPKPVRNLVLGGVLGLMLGVGAAFGRQGLDTKVRSREDVQHATGGMPVLGLIPHLHVSQNGGRRNRKFLPGAAPALPRSSSLVTRDDPRGAAAEAYRALRTNLTFANIERVPQVTVVTSALPGDGKSTSAANLATALAQQGQTVLLVDGDLRRGLMHETFGLEREPGLTNVLLGKVALEDAVQTVSISEAGDFLHVLPTGISPPNPAELVGSDRMRTLLQQMRADYEAVIFDCPPLNLVTDGALLGSMADTTILVIRTGATDRRAVHHAVMQLHQVQATVGGVIINDIDVSGSYYGYGYGTYFDEETTGTSSP